MLHDTSVPDTQRSGVSQLHNYCLGFLGLLRIDEIPTWTFFSNGGGEDKPGTAPLAHEVVQTAACLARA